MNIIDTQNVAVPTWSAHSTSRSLIVAALLAAAPFIAAVGLTYPTLAAAFVGGLAVAAAALAATPTRLRRVHRPVHRAGKGRRR